MKKIGLIALIVILSLGIIGVGYALWSQTLHINGTVTAATFDVNFASTGTDPTAPVGTGGAASATIVAGKTVNIVIANAYPQWTGVWTLTVTNNGSIPVIFALTKDAAPADTANIFTASADSGLTVNPGASETYTITAAIPNWTNTTNTGDSFEAHYSILASQNTP